MTYSVSVLCKVYLSGLVWSSLGEVSETYLVLAHAVARVEDDSVTRHIVVIRWVVVKAVVSHASILQLNNEAKERD